MNKKLIVLVVYGLFSISGFSQTDSVSKGRVGINMETNFRYYNLKSINNELKSAGFNELLEFHGYSIGISDRYLDKNSFATINITWIQSGGFESSNKQASFNMFDLSVEMHWVLSKSNKWLIYPYSGFGSGYSFLRLTENEDSINFKSSIQNISIQDKYVKTYFSKTPLFFVNFGLGIDRKIRISFYDFYFGLNLGYRLSTNSKLDIDGSPLNRYNCFELNARIRFEFNDKITNSRPKYFKYIN